MAAINVKQSFDYFPIYLLNRWMEKLFRNYFHYKSSRNHQFVFSPKSDTTTGNTFIRSNMISIVLGETNNSNYQPPLLLTALLHVDLINVAYLMACAFIRS